VNVASEEILDVRGIAEAIARLLGRPADLRVSDVPRDFDLVADTTLLRTQLAPRFIDFESGLRSTVSAWALASST
jgi:hypothetical protein